MASPCTLTILRPGAEPELRTIELENAEGRSTPGLKALHQVLDPLLETTDLEHVHVLYQGKPTDMFVDEIGVEKRLARNEAATAIYRSFWLSTHPDDDPESLPAIYGTAVLFSRTVWS